MQSVPETEPPLQHVRLNPRCGACRYAFEHHDRIASLMGMIQRIRIMSSPDMEI